MNRKRWLLFVIIVIIVSFAFLGVIKTEENDYPNIIVSNYDGIDKESVNNYKIEVEINTQEKMYYGKEWVSYTNNTQNVLKELFFHIYPNAFKDKKTAPLLNGYMLERDFDPGYINLKKIEVDGKEAEFIIEGDKDTVLKVKLQHFLKESEKANIYLEFEGKIPRTEDRFGYGNKSINFGNWYPILAVYDESGWNTEPYYSIGDPFYSCVSNYVVNITVPEDIIVATSGKIVKEKKRGNKKVFEIEGNLIRDFAFSISNDYIVRKRNVDGILMSSYSFTDDDEINEYILDTGQKALTLFSKVFGKYPYSNFSIVASDFSGGMEYPEFIMIGEDYYDNDYLPALENVIVHETAHQWWYGLVGNNEIDEAWLDESLATYSESIYIGETYGEKERDRYMDILKINYEHMKDALKFDETVVKPLSKFKDWDDYGSLVYTKGALFIDSIRKDYGEKALYRILNRYYEEFKYLNATTENFKRVCEDVTGDDFTPRMNLWLYGID
ncbi:M1 family peptidase [Acidilutibacter cellobiosedens]|uniref:M1 family peptidase n=1 Tax=Acidilutibacter cellobiosedens TaxID=2507161 RepID=A0A410Q864_9FIRM|nr:M1 family metallopeptidase [Acidilutibacter cellobiosedens]QAT60104.1 M1 family peptidase [Acidilutibacter cellobiosedens]